MLKFMLNVGRRLFSFNRLSTLTQSIHAQSGSTKAGSEKVKEGRWSTGLLSVGVVSALIFSETIEQRKGNQCNSTELDNAEDKMLRNIFKRM